MIDEILQVESLSTVPAAASQPVDGLGPLVAQLREIVVGLAIYRPDPTDGANWLSYDSALDDLYRAVQSLEGVAMARQARAGLG